MAKKTPKKKVKEKPKDLKIKPVNVHGLEREFVNFFQIRFGPSDFTLEFCDLPQPDEELLEEGKKVGYIEAPIKYRIACTPAFVELFIFAITNNYRKYRETKEREKNDRGRANSAS